MPGLFDDIDQQFGITPPAQPAPKRGLFDDIDARFGVAPTADAPPPSRGLGGFFKDTAMDLAAGSNLLVRHGLELARTAEAGIEQALPVVGGIRQLLMGNSDTAQAAYDARVQVLDAAGQTLSEGAATWQDQQSDALKAKRANRAAQLPVYDPATGLSADRIFNTLQNPSLLISDTVQSAPEMAAIIATTGAGAQARLAQMVAAGVPEQIARQVVMREAAVANIGASGLSSGASAGSQARDEVLAMPAEDPAARSAMAQDASNKAFAVSTPLAMLAARLGAAGEAQLATRQLDQRLLPMVALQTADEGLQGGSEQFGTNVGMKYSGADPERDLTMDVLDNAAMEALAGGTMGAGMWAGGKLSRQNDIDTPAAGGATPQQAGSLADTVRQAAAQTAQGQAQPQQPAPAAEPAPPSPEEVYVEERKAALQERTAALASIDEARRQAVLELRAAGLSPDQQAKAETEINNQAEQARQQAQQAFTQRDGAARAVLEQAVREAQQQAAKAPVPAPAAPAPAQQAQPTLQQPPLPAAAGQPADTSRAAPAATEIPGSTPAAPPAPGNPVTTTPAPMQPQAAQVQNEPQNIPGSMPGTRAAPAGMQPPAAGMRPDSPAMQPAGQTMPGTVANPSAAPQGPGQAPGQEQRAGQRPAATNARTAFQEATAERLRSIVEQSPTLRSLPVEARRQAIDELVSAQLSNEPVPVDPTSRLINGKAIIDPTRVKDGSSEGTMLETMLNALVEHVKAGGEGAVTQIDLGNLGGINQWSGQLGGDKAIADISRIIEKAVADAGLADQVELARYGGDEFFVLSRTGADATRRALDAANRAVQEYTGKTTPRMLNPGLDENIRADRDASPEDKALALRFMDTVLADIPKKPVELSREDLAAFVKEWADGTGDRLKITPKGKTKIHVGPLTSVAATDTAADLHMLADAALNNAKTAAYGGAQNADLAGISGNGARRPQASDLGEAPGGDGTLPADAPASEAGGAERGAPAGAVPGRLAQRAPAARAAVNPDKDPLHVAVRKLGGVSISETVADGFDRSDFKQLPRGTFTRNGRSLDAMAEVLAELGYPVTDRAGNPDPQRVDEHLRAAIAGNYVYTPAGDYARVEAEFGDQGDRGTWPPTDDTIPGFDGQQGNPQDAGMEPPFRAGPVRRPGAMTRDQAQQLVDERTAGWKGAPKIRVIDAIPGEPRAKGYYLNGEVVIAAGAHTSKADLIITLEHESLGHYALQLRGKEAMTRALTAVLRLERSGDATVKAWAKEVDRLQPGLRPEVRAEEMLARAVETGEYQTLPALVRLVKDVLAMLRDLLTKGQHPAAKWADAKLLQATFRGLREGRRLVEQGAMPGIKAGGEKRFHKAWHGSPHDHDGFTLDKIGTGEGAQVFGWGLYFAGQREVAEHYRTKLTSANGGPVRTDRTSLIPRQMDASVADVVSQLDREILVAESNLESAGDNPDAFEPGYADKLRARLGKLREKREQANRQGRLYEVELAPREDEYLLWDKPLAEQSASVRAALPEIIGKLRKSFPGFNEERATGKHLYEAYKAHRGGDAESASRALNEAGIPGIKYMDGDSRRKPLREIKAEFLNELPDDAEFEEVLELVGTGQFSPANDAIIQALADNDWLGFDYPAQAISAALGGRLSNFDPSPELLQAVADAQEGATFNYVIFDEKDIAIAAKYRKGGDVDTDSPAFKRWFGDSRVVGDDGRPLAVYHGTNADITSFAPRNGGASWFAKDADLANDFTAGGRRSKGLKPKKGSAVYPVYLSLQNPFDLVAAGFPLDGRATLRQLVEAAGLSRDFSRIRSDVMAQRKARSMFAPYMTEEDIAEHLATVTDASIPVWSWLDEQGLIDALMAAGFDGLVAEEAYSVSNGRGKPRDVRISTTYAVFDATQIKSIFNSGTFDGSNPDIRFRKGEEDGQQTKLSALHNLSADNLAFADKMGGIAVPSIGVVTRDKGGVDGFGEITLIGTRDMADPRQEPVFSSDAYTARFPKPVYKKAKVKDADKLVSFIRPWAKQYDNADAEYRAWEYTYNNPDPEQIITPALNNAAWQAAFLDSKGISVEPVMRSAPLPSGIALEPEQVEKLGPQIEAVMAAGGAMSSSALMATPEFAALQEAFTREVKAYYKKTGYDPDTDVTDNETELYFARLDRLMSWYRKRDRKEVDRFETREALVEAVTPYEAEFKAWVESKVLPILGEPMLQLGRKKVPYTLDNIVDAMTSTRIKGEEKTISYGAGQVRAAASMKFSDIEQMRAAAKDAIVDPAEYEKAKEHSALLLRDYQDVIVQFSTITNWQGRIDTWEALDASMRAIAKWATGKKRDKASLRAALKREEFNAEAIPDEILGLGMEAGEALLKAPVPYFEAKPQRSVSLGEFAGAAIPANAPETVRAILDKHGIPYREYEGDNRQQVVRDFTKELAADKPVLFRKGGAGKQNRPGRAANLGFGTDAAGDRVFKPGEAAYEKLAAGTRKLLGEKIREKWGAAWSMASTSPAAFRQLMREYVQEWNKAQAGAVAISKDAAPLSEAERILLSDVLEQELAAGFIPPAEIEAIAVAMRHALTQQTDELVRLGMLSADSADRWRDTYLPRLYKRAANDDLAKESYALAARMKVRGDHLKGRGIFKAVAKEKQADYEKLGWEKRADGEDGPIMWRDFTREEREKMGENRDAVERFLRGFLHTQRDIAVGRLLERVSEDPELASEERVEGWPKVPTDEIGSTGGVKKYGKLAGMYVHPEVWEHLKYQIEDRNELERLYRHALSAWKEGKTVLNPVAHTNNVISNTVLVTAAGANAADIARGLRSYFTKDAYFKEATDLGLLGNEYYGTEIQAILGEDAKNDMRPMTFAGRWLRGAAEKFWKNKAFEGLRKAYDIEDAMFKIVLFRRAREGGMTPEQAMEYAETFVFNYTDLPPGVKKIRDYALPFISYTYKAVPAMTRLALTRPHRMAAFVGAVYGLNAAAFMALGMDGDDEDEERKVMPEYSKGFALWGVPKLVRLPVNLDGKATYLDIYRWIPLGDFVDTGNDSAGADLPAWMTPGGPLWDTYNVLYANRDSFTGEDFFKPTDTGGQAFAKVAHWQAAQWVPMYYHSKKVLDAARNQVGDSPMGQALDALGFSGMGRRGEPVPMVPALAGSVGVKLRTFDPDEERRKRLQGVGFEVRELRQAMRREQRDKSLPEDRRRELARQRLQQIRKLSEKAGEFRQGGEAEE